MAAAVASATLQVDASNHVVAGRRRRPLGHRQALPLRRPPLRRLRSRPPRQQRRVDAKTRMSSSAPRPSQPQPCSPLQPGRTPAWNPHYPPPPCPPRHRCRTRAPPRCPAPPPSPCRPHPPGQQASSLRRPPVGPPRCGCAACSVTPQPRACWPQRRATWTTRTSDCAAREPTRRPLPPQQHPQPPAPCPPAAARARP